MGKDGISGLIPEIYYDLIARVAAGASLILLMFFSTSQPITSLSQWTLIVLIVGLGYVVGHLLTTISSILNIFVLNGITIHAASRILHLDHALVSKSPWGLLAELYERIDRVAEQNTTGGAILMKMEAGAALTDNLLSGWLVVLAYLAMDGNALFEASLYQPTWQVVVLITPILILSVFIRRFIFIVRQDRLLTILSIRR